MVEDIIQVGQIGLNVMHSIQEGRETVLFLHFSGGNLHMWNGVLPQFAERYSIIAPEFRGHGKSDKPHTGYHIDGMAQDLYLLLRELQVERCHVVGSSMGAEIGLSLAAAHPELVQSLILEGALCNEFGEHGLFNGTAEEIEERKKHMRAELAERQERVFTSKAEYVAEERAGLEQEGLWNEHFQPFYENGLQQLEDGRYTYCYLNRVRTEYIQKFWDLKFEAYYRQVECPVLFLPSEAEWANERVRSSLDHFASLVQQAEIKRISDSIHAYVWLLQPAEAGQTVLRFIARHSVSG
ncbi:MULTISPECIES: alpha/beta hydrolase [unclassified Paenibacillus]|uniref:alpha/beta hydrolase n=1 Tax=unclassified Paenibacillus TaxID=185978 RepID=UPI0024063246|nr:MULTISPECIES: alpha/beta hydrolase [unclassified Paenibacillus]MDF9844780.1 pimeloyl-ACP methyl ester carboxylesterase [Paenibacillus sp. PastF-2]MDF9851419.1 pimeloyl-ACP methyl ester carboxylesterase [Paenibacillus sp. PastM-2]MDF9857964.1 pimeloyl-ACP methyl ester carboxylesterase [Paenibacillus sp. PastF-1]MDH6483232.1 pimeloyl-ACP methyl ester carboxylesterase [Paenibacillus sp. PastH-2]MDH6510642.1 pimeloyl-ACP methyl ester carboxylesterase [Paenibacillus sp. PastM-3]